MTVDRRAEARGGHRIGLALLTAMTAVLGSVAAVPAAAADTTSLPGPILKVSETAHAPVNECFSALGGDHPTPDANGKCPTGYQPKIDAGYVWAAARSGDYGYFGTAANVICQSASAMIGDPAPHLVKGVNACEYGGSSGAAAFGSKLGDARMPHVFRVNADTQKTEDVSPVDDPLFKVSSGVRGAAADEDVVFMMGLKQATVVDPRVGLTLFAFEGSTGRYLGSTLRTDMVTGRGGVVGPDGNLYLAGRSAADPDSGTSGLGGTVLKWTGSKSDPFRFEKVGTLPNDAAYITVVGNRLAASGWMGVLPAKKSASFGGPSKIWMSPEIPSGGLTSADAGSWKSLFSWDDYDPDPVVGKSIVWGGIKEWRGDLYVGSYNYGGMTATTSVWNEYGEPTSEAKRMRDLTKSNRAATIFRISKPGTADQKVTLLYGEKTLPVYNPSTDAWTNKPNKLGQTPKFGASGFGNPGNMYSWTFTTFKDKLYMATADATGMVTPAAFSSKLVYGLSTTTATAMEKVIGPALFTTMGGGDVWRMDNPKRPAVAETLNGFNNRTEHGVRVFLPFEDKGFLWAGMAGSYNLRVTEKDRGGWALNRLTQGSMRAPLVHRISSDAAKAVLGGIGLGAGA
ncbi:hypothetical protein [Streptomyces anulatus]|uniref:hypothetical protein n=1 Tax=Streptomyces anulatus TaxID=1892 RepID=UPI00371A9FA6